MVEELKSSHVVSPIDVSLFLESFGRTWLVELERRCCCLDLPGGLSMRRGSSERKKECDRVTREEKHTDCIMGPPDF